MLSLLMPLRVLYGPVVHISGILLFAICERSFISERNISEKGLIALQLFRRPLTKLYMLLKIVPMRFLV
jgi:hypothetical protein